MQLGELFTSFRNAFQQHPSGAGPCAVARVLLTMDSHGYLAWDAATKGLYASEDDRAYWLSEQS